MADITQRIDVLNVVGSTADNGEVRVDLGDLASDEGISKDSPMWGLDGFVSRPNDPNFTTKEGALAFYIQDADEKFVISVKDNRFSDKVGTLSEGDRAIISNCEARVFLKKERSAITLYTVDENENFSMMIDLSGVDGLITYINGQTYIQQHTDKIVLGVNGGGMILIDENGVQIEGNNFRCNTAGGNLGVLTPGTAATPAVPPLPVANSIIGGPSGIAGVASTSWVVSPK